jgi:hypothetical protein
VDDLTPLLTAVDSFADRLRALPQSRLSRGAAAEGRELASELAARALRWEEPEGQPAPPREMPDAGLFAVADQVAVAGHDLIEALRSAFGETAGGEAGSESRLGAEVASAVELVKAAAKRCGL